MQASQFNNLLGKTTSLSHGDLNLNPENVVLLVLQLKSGHITLHSRLFLHNYLLIFGNSKLSVLWNLPFVLIPKLKIVGRSQFFTYISVQIIQINIGNRLKRITMMQHFPLQVSVRHFWNYRSRVLDVFFRILKCVLLYFMQILNRWLNTQINEIRLCEYRGLPSLGRLVKVSVANALIVFLHHSIHVRAGHLLLLAHFSNYK